MSAASSSQLSEMTGGSVILAVLIETLPREKVMGSTAEMVPVVVRFAPTKEPPM